MKFLSVLTARPQGDMLYGKRPASWFNYDQHIAVALGNIAQQTERLGVKMGGAIVDNEGYRLGVGMVVINREDRVFLGCRTDAPTAWQFPQGGIHVGEEPLAAMYRELMEEVGLAPEQVEVLATSREWYHYALPNEHRLVEGRLVVGQKQRWYLLRLLVDDAAIHLGHTGDPEFCQWRWAPFWEPVSAVIAFKQPMYQQLLTEFAEHLKK